jgi:hypothetical protein
MKEFTEARKIVHVVKDMKNHGDEFDCGVTYDYAEACKIAANEVKGMSSYDLKRSTIFIQSFLVKVEAGQSAEDAFYEALLTDEAELVAFNSEMEGV